jgi:hypothetical protein
VSSFIRVLGGTGIPACVALGIEAKRQGRQDRRRETANARGGTQMKEELPTNLTNLHESDSALFHSCRFVRFVGNFVVGYFSLASEASEWRFIPHFRRVDLSTLTRPPPLPQNARR